MKNYTELQKGYDIDVVAFKKELKNLLEIFGLTMNLTGGGDDIYQNEGYHLELYQIRDGYLVEGENLDEFCMK